MQLGAVRVCKVPDQAKSDSEVSLPNGTPESICAHVSTNNDDPECFHKLLKALDLPESKLTPEEMTELKGLLKVSTDVFALNDSELGCTSVVHHSIDTGNHAPIKQQPL